MRVTEKMVGKGRADLKKGKLSAYFHQSSNWRWIRLIQDKPTFTKAFMLLLFYPI